MEQNTKVNMSRDSLMDMVFIIIKMGRYIEESGTYRSGMGKASLKSQMGKLGREFGNLGRKFVGSSD